MDDSGRTGHEQEPQGSGPGSTHLAPTDARQAVKTGRVRYILAISLSATILGMVIVWIVIR
jgi:hypothetical protein